MKVKIWIERISFVCNLEFYLVEESKHAKTVGMLESFSQVPVFLVSVDDVHFERQTHVIEGVFRTTVVLVSPMEVEAFNFILVVQGTTENVWKTESFLFFFGAVFGDGQRHWKIQIWLVKRLITLAD